MMPIITIAKILITTGSTNDGLSFTQATTGVNVSSRGKKLRDKCVTYVRNWDFFLWMSCSSPLSLPQMISLILLPMSWSEEIVTWTLEIWPWVMLRVMNLMRKVILNSHSIRNMWTSNVHQVHGSYLTTNLLLMCSSILNFFQTSNNHQQTSRFIDILALPPWPWWVILLVMEPSGSILMEKQTSSLYLTWSLNLKWHKTATAATSSFSK